MVSASMTSGLRVCLHILFSYHTQSVVESIRSYLCSVSRERLCMRSVNPRAISCHPPLALKLRSGIVLTSPSARWHFELLVQARIPEDQWAEMVAESGFLDSEGTFIAGRGVVVYK